MFEGDWSQDEVSMLPGERRDVKFKKCIDNGRANHIILRGNDLTDYQPTLCFHSDNSINKHGFGLRTYILENIYSSADAHCKKCGFKCVNDSGKNAHLADGRLIRAGIGTGFFIYDAGHGAIFEIAEKEARRTFLQ